MSESWRRVAITLAVVLLAAAVLGGCGPKDEQPTDLMDQPPAGEGAGASSPTDVPPPPPGPGGYGEGGDASQAGSGSGTAAAPLELEDVQFEFDRYSLTAEAREVLARNARLLEQHGDVGVIVEGHCDERGTVEYNLALGEKRAGSVKDYLVRYGIENSRLRTISYGEERPLDPASTEEAWARNRRAHLREQ